MNTFSHVIRELKGEPGPTKRAARLDLTGSRGVASVALARASRWRGRRRDHLRRSGVELAPIPRGAARLRVQRVSW